MKQTTRDITGVEAGDVIGVRYEPVHGKTGSTKDAVLTVTDSGSNVTATDDDGNEYVVRTDGGDAMELAKKDNFGNARRTGWVDEVTRMGWADSRGGLAVMTDEHLSADKDEWENMTLRFDDPRRDDRVSDEPTDHHALEVGDIVVIDVGKHTGPADWGSRRRPHFNKTAYRVTNDVSGYGTGFDPCDGRASKLRANGHNSASAGSTSLWANSRVSADAKFYRVLSE